MEMNRDLILFMGKAARSEDMVLATRKIPLK